MAGTRPDLPDILRLQRRAAAGAAVTVTLAAAACILEIAGAHAAAAVAAGAAALAAAPVSVLVLLNARRMDRAVVTPLNELRAALYRTVMGDPTVLSLPVTAAREVAELGDGVGELIALVRLERSHKEALTDAAQSRSTTALEAALQTQLERERSEVDALTGLLNRRKLDSDLDIACSVAARTRKPLAFCMVDVDNFKRYNDEHGHSQGDEVLRILAQALLGALRRSDTAYRYGGEEFSIILRECPPEEAAAVIHRVRAAIISRFREAGMTMTASFGLAFLPHHGTVPPKLVEAADAALYRAKENGRDQVVVAG
jgi:diguanylate cyclase (GGDEF)-like protein